MANGQHHQHIMRREVEEVLHGEMLTPDKRSQLNYVQAFIAECMRYRPVSPMGLPHNTTTDTKIGSMSIPKDTTIYFLHWAPLHDDQHWRQPEVFAPERFLDSDGKYNPRSHTAFVPFSVGRRMCPGERLAMADLLYVVTRMLQCTRGCAIELDNGPGSVNLDGDHNFAGAFVSFDYKIVIKKL